VVSGVGSISATALLARYSRENEREADRLGMDYMVAAGANPQGMVDLMGMLREMNDRQPGALEVMFSSHPMSDERFANVQRQLNDDYRNETRRAIQRERYMDNTAGLRRRGNTIRALRDAELAMGQQDYNTANSKLAQARQATPDDYPAWVITARAQMMQEQTGQAVQSLRQARQLQPQEGQAMYLLGINLLAQDDAGGALAEFQRYEQVLPGNPNTRFLVGYSHEQQQNQPQAATAYQDYLRQVQQGQQAEYAFGRLREWGYL
jgi:predicted Zn-dependent protease